jgi:hypothetical protein
MRVVADANVFVSAALGRSPEARSVRIINAGRDGRVGLVMSPGLDWKQITAWAGHGDVRQTWNATGTSCRAAKSRRQRLDASVTRAQPTPTEAHTVARDPTTTKSPSILGF